MNRGAELKAPSTVACSDLLAVMVFVSVRQPNHIPRSGRERDDQKVSRELYLPQSRETRCGDRLELAHDRND